MECPPLLKIELHAHFEVNVTPQILHDVWIRKQQAGCKTSPIDLMREEKYTDSNTEELVSMISSFLGDLLTDKESIQYALRKVLVNFFSDSVVYLELRVKPRRTRDLSAEEYIQIFLDTIKDFEIHVPAMHTQLVLCVNRSHSFAAAKSVVSLASRLRADEGPGVVGIDFCGDPTVRIYGEISMLTPAFEQAAENGLGITTGDAGVFGIPLPTEYRLVAQHFNFTSDQMRHLARQGIEAIFGGEKEKQRLRKVFFK
ncbi:hypothetical protein E4U17_000613 [Claviceps sp. LM77 group G4]|nr:hypothetical protein E4U17_000613 [Claviceps sp. LM77 group G4]KAG6078773.1 hypothetical protein E4U33_000590 [Claviceps sp. LM78 group G4]KAG6078829.1 hypothetical protein E4U16_001408 [Claviceps sp. LM84 group G4]